MLSFAPGGPADIVARILAEPLSRVWSRPAVVENRGGAGGNIGADLVAKAAPDGYTLGQGPVGALAITRHMVAKLPYDIERDIQPVALVTTGRPQWRALVVSKTAQSTTMRFVPLRKTAARPVPSACGWTTSGSSW